MEQFKLFFISCWIWIGPWGLLLKCTSGLLKDEFVFVIFILFYFVCFFFSLCHIFEYFNNFVLDHWLFAFIFQNSVYVNCPLERQVGISFHLSCFFFFLQTSFDQLYKKQQHILCAWTCPIFSACHPIYIWCFVEKTRWLFNNGYHSFKVSWLFCVQNSLKLIKVSILEFQCTNLCVCMCITCEASSQTIAAPSNHKLATTSFTFSKMWTAMAANNTLLQSTFEVTDAPRYTKQSSFQTYTHHFQDENVGRLATLNKFFYLNKVERMTHMPGPHQLQKNKYTTHISYKLKLTFNLN